MTARIQTLSIDLRNKIAAGEVVERPASVVKELVENSLDAGARSLQVVVENGGQTLIQVSDDGRGIPSGDLPRACERFSTSKIARVEDLFRIQTLGFRGEALASIASVSRLRIASCPAGEAQGAALEIEAGQAGAVAPAPGVPGTQISVRNLFFNTPARLKFLKSPKTELRHIVSMVRRFGLACPEVALRLVADDRELLNVHPESLEDRIAALFDPTYRENLLALHYSKGDYGLEGFLGNLNLVRSRPGEQYLFLNGRFIQVRLLNSAVYAGYQSLAKRGEFPFFVINLTMPVDQVDVNVHPMKLEVRFRDEWRVYHVLKSGVAEILEQVTATIPSFDRFPAAPAAPSPHRPEAGGSAPLPFAAPDHHGFTIPPRGLERAKSYASDLATRAEDTGEMDLDRIWQVHNRYILSQISSGLVLIDQHVAHERVLYEEARKAFESQPLSAQTLLFPEVLEFSPDEFSVLLDILPGLEKLGFRLREFGKHTVMVEAVPSEMGWGNEKKILRDILDHYLEHNREFSSYQDNLAASFACHAAIKAGDPLTKPEMQALVNRLFATRHPYYCPHGRPILIQLTLDELDKRFERK